MKNKIKTLDKVRESKIKVGIRGKRGLSVVIGYVLLVVIGISLSLLVYTWMKSQILKPEEGCPEVSLVLTDYSCNEADKVIRLILQNKGLFNIDGFIARVSDNLEGAAVYNLMSEESIENFFTNPLEPNEKSPLQRFSYEEPGFVAKIEIQPFVFDEDEKIILCEKAVISQSIEDCEERGSITPPGEECESDGDCASGEYCDAGVCKPIPTECTVALDCGEDGWTGSPYCKEGNVYQLYRVWQCIDGSCSSSEEERLKEDCGERGCEAGSCGSMPTSTEPRFSALVNFGKFPDFGGGKTIGELITSMGEAKISWARVVGTSLSAPEIKNFDTAIAEDAKNKGIEIIVNIGLGNKEKNDDRVSYREIFNSDSYTEQEKEDAANEVIDKMVALIEKYTTPEYNVKYWQIANEVSGSKKKYFIDKEYYVMILNGVYEQIKGSGGVCEDCKIVIGGFVPGIGLIYSLSDAECDDSDKCVKHRDYLNYVKTEAEFDIFDFHMNFQPGSGFGGFNQYKTRMDDALGAIKKVFGTDFSKPIWITEIGAPSNFIYFKEDYSIILTENFHKDDVVKRYVYAMGHGVERITWNPFYNEIFLQQPISDIENCETNYCEWVERDGSWFIKSDAKGLKGPLKGVVYPDLTEKSSFNTLKFLQGKIGRFNSIETIREQDNNYVYKFNVGGEAVYVAWCDPTEFDENGENDYDELGCSAEVSLPGAAGKKIFSVQGGGIGTSSATITLGKSPVFIE